MFINLTQLQGWTFDFSVWLLTWKFTLHVSGQSNLRRASLCVFMGNLPMCLLLEGCVIWFILPEHLLGLFMW